MPSLKNKAKHLAACFIVLVLSDKAFALTQCPGRTVEKPEWAIALFCVFVLLGIISAAMVVRKSQLPKIQKGVLAVLALIAGAVIGMVVFVNMLLKCFPL